MKIEPLYRQQRLKKIMVLCILVSLVTCWQGQIKEYNYTFEIPQSKMKDLSQSSVEMQSFQGQVLGEFLVKQPKQMGTIFQIIVSQQGNSHSSQGQQPSQLPQSQSNKMIIVPEIQGITFDTYSWPIRKETLYYGLPKSKSQLPQIQIVSTAHSSNLQSGFIPRTTYLLLSSGNIQVLKHSNQQLEVQKQYTYKQNQNQTATQILWSDVYLYEQDGFIYLLVDRKLWKANFSTQQQELSYTFQKLVAENVEQIIRKEQETHVFTSDECWRISESQQGQTIKYSDIGLALNQTHVRFIDFAVYGQDIYLLDQKLGIVKFSQNRDLKLFRIQRPELASGINVFNHTLLVTYNLGSSHILDEYHFCEQDQKLYSNKLYSHYPEGQIYGLILFSQYMVVNRGSEITIGRHSLSRSFPYIFHRQSQIVQTNSFIDEIIQLHQLSSKISSAPGYIVVTSRAIQMFQFQQSKDNEFQQKWIKLSSQRAGSYNFDIKYTGTCKLNQEDFNSEYCSFTKKVELHVKDTVQQTLQTWWIWTCGALVVAVFLVIVFIICRKYFLKKQDQFISLLNQQSKKNSQTVVQLSFQSVPIPINIT